MTELSPRRLPAQQLSIEFVERASEIADAQPRLFDPHKVLQGSLLLIRHCHDGITELYNYRIKSNALYGLALGDSDGIGWATFSGK